jgi:hypothetical protein
LLTPIVAMHGSSRGIGPSTTLADYSRPGIPGSDFQ